MHHWNPKNKATGSSGRGGHGDTMPVPLLAACNMNNLQSCSGCVGLEYTASSHLMRVTTCSHPDHDRVTMGHEEWSDEDHEDVIAEQRHKEHRGDTPAGQ